MTAYMLCGFAGLIIGFGFGYVVALMNANDPKI